MKHIYLIFGILSLLYSTISYSASCSGTCRWCGQYNNIPCGNWTCTNGGQTTADTIKKLPTGSIKNSAAAAADTDGCTDSYPASQNVLPFTVESIQYKTLPASVKYTVWNCTCP